MIAPLLETRHLQLLVALDEHGSLQAAARALHLTPSALSQQLKDMEARLGGPLFHRTWRRLGVTAAGKRLTEAARALLVELSRAETEARALLAGSQGTIRVATACHQSYRWLGAVLQSYARAWPAIEVTIVPEATTAPAAWLIDRRLDVALVASEIEHGPQLEVEPLFRDELVALVGREHPWFGRRRIPVTAFADQHVWADADAFRGDTSIARAFATAGVQPRKVTIVPIDGPVGLEMARANLGVTILPRWSTEPATADGSLHAVSIGDRLWLEWGLATRAEPADAPLVAFLATVRAHHPRARTPRAA